MPCMGQDSCYPLAFGIPAILMIVATAIFMAGSFWYKKPPPKENIFGEVARLMTVNPTVNCIEETRFSTPLETSTGTRKGRATGLTITWLIMIVSTTRGRPSVAAFIRLKCYRCMQWKAEKGQKKACHKKGLIEDTKSLLRLIIMFLPVPMFWALYDQQGSVWLIQG